ncbi:hypothetical protein DFJ58DRAFT_126300 [Suillus subalutaceus]|uniref:uncharacterized protein n=1 Tax=Suillus subalutaceus TaxID=48586 RepID=UPI001B8666CF|nr:uncharacterized protein DFJ58DRAFT_126300 [Suillus subalutaceus]KAG1838372.1 hypothetical protein DFJ58DRAFT_126300 [Suillus subalutaceus]
MFLSALAWPSWWLGMPCPLPSCNILYLEPSLLFILPMSSPPNPSLLTGLFIFQSSRTPTHSLVPLPLCLIMHACTLLRTTALVAPYVDRVL